MANETLRVRGIGSLKDACPFDLHALGVPEVDRGRRVEANPRVTVLVVVPAKEVLAEGPSILDRAEAVRELGAVFEGLV